MYKKGDFLSKEVKYNCIFGGGGIRGMCYIGALKALKEFGININSIAGSSVGAVFAALYAVGYSEDEIKELFLDFNLNMFRDLNINIFNTDLSLSKGEIFLDWLREKFSLKVTNNKDKKKKITFKDLEKDLYILTIDINTNTPFIFSKKTTPDCEIAIAVRASASLPGLMKPVNYNGLLLVDGDLIKSWPAWKIYEDLDNENSRLLEFRLEGSRDGSDIKNPMDFVNSIINTIWYLSTENVFNLYYQNDRYDYVVIDTKDIIMFDFTIDKTQKEELIEKGYRVTKDYFSKTLIEKKERIFGIYQNIKRKLELSQKALKYNNVNDLITIVNEILSSMSEDINFIDKSVYEKIKELKNKILANVKKYIVFGKKLQNADKIDEEIVYILNIIKNRNTDIKEYVTKFSNKS